MDMNYLERLHIDPAVRSGKPTIRGTRITVQDILEYLASGMSQEEVLADFPDLSPKISVPCCFSRPIGNAASFPLLCEAALRRESLVPAGAGVGGCLSEIGARA